MRVAFIGTSSEYSLVHLKAVEEEFNVVAIICAAPRNYQGNDESYSRRNVLYRNAVKKGIPFYFAKNLSSQRIEDVLKDVNCDLICVASCSQLIKKNIIEIPKIGVINAHPAKLPYYKGPNPTYWIFYHQESEGACTIHYIDEGEDSGDIILQECFAIPFGMTQTEYSAKILSISPKLMQKAVRQLSQGTSSRIKQPNIKTFRARNIKSEERSYNWSDWDVKSAYKFLRGTGELDFLYSKSCWKISIDSYVEGKFLNKHNTLVCKGGVILYSKHFCFKRLVKSFLRK